MWLNSTLGVLMLIAARVETEGPWMKMKKPVLERLPVLDPLKLTTPAAVKLAQAYDRLSKEQLKPLPDVESDATRAAIDEAIADALGIRDLAPLRHLLAHEPLLRPAPAGEVVEEPDADEVDGADEK